MNFSADRASGLFFLLFGLGMYFLVNPGNIEAVDGGNLAPETFPNILSVVIAVCGGLLVLVPTREKIRDPMLMGKAGLYAGLLVIGGLAMSRFGFEYVAPVLALAIMLLTGERRRHWLAFGVIGMPALTWFLVTEVLGRALP